VLDSAKRKRRPTGTRSPSTSQRDYHVVSLPGLERRGVLVVPPMSEVERPAREHERRAVGRHLAQAGDYERQGPVDGDPQTE